MTAPRPDEDGYRLWLRYERIAEAARLAEARATLAQIVVDGASPARAAAAGELGRGLAGLLGNDVSVLDANTGDGAWRDGTLYVGDPARAPAPARGALAEALAGVASPEAFAIRRGADGDGRRFVALAARGDAGLVYGAFHLLRHLQLARPIAGVDVVSAPRAPLRMLDHWDNLDGTIERGYAGHSLWDWHKLPDYVSPRIRDYARACASIGINAASLTNVNADARVLSAALLPRVAAIADVLRPWGIRVFLPARFSAPVEQGGLPTADPHDARVAAWWRAKVAEIHAHVPDFGGFIVKASSEGQPGPQDYGRTHADGANVLADALAAAGAGGLVIWRAFVYRADVAEDRAKQAFAQLRPDDGRFRPNVLLQAKYGPIDFQPREPPHPLFGAMPRTPMVLELMVTQEYTGFATHLFYAGAQWEEILAADTHAAGPGSTVARVADGSLFGHARAGIAGVANVGDDRNWCGHPFAQANFYAFGRLAWDHRLGADAVADEWLRLTFTGDDRFVAPARRMMRASREAVVDYMTPLGLHHLMAKDHHYGPGPWVDDAGRPDWTSVYYHRADDAGIGFDRTATGSDAVALYAPPVAAVLGDVRACPEELLLWFHHVAWDHPMRSGRTLWDELCHRYSRGVATVAEMRRTWDGLAPHVDAARFEHVRALLAVQEKEARWWRNACLLYFQTFSRRPLPADLPPLEGTLAEYRSRHPILVPGI